MSRRAGLAWMVVIGIIAIGAPAHAWGPKGHHIVTELALQSLPPGPLRAMLMAHKGFLTEHSVDPDNWRDRDKLEGYHHFMDIDRYGQAPFLALPRSRAQAEARYGSETVLKNGTVPWTIGEWYHHLVADMRRNRTGLVLVDAAVLSHYAADTHVPFHATENYDGQFSGQIGVHARFETMLVDRYVKPEALSVGQARFIDDPIEAAFGWLVESAEDVPAVLAADKAAHADHPDYEADGYREAFWRGAGPIVTRRLEEAGVDVSSLWYSAWITAGGPALDAPATEIADTYDATHDVTPVK